MGAREPRSRTGCSLARNCAGCIRDLRCESRARPSHCPEARQTPAPETEMDRDSSRRFAAEGCDDPRRPAGHDRCQKCDGRNGNDRAVGTGPPGHQGRAQRRLHQHGGCAAANPATQTARAHRDSDDAGDSMSPQPPQRLEKILARVGARAGPGPGTLAAFGFRFLRSAVYLNKVSSGA